jgi:predicted dehydrogenase
MLDEVENFLKNPAGLNPEVDAIIISVPPLQKQKYIDLANKYNVACFAEADVILYNGNYYASSTMRYHPAIQEIKELIDSGTLGKVYTFSYHMGQSLYDWHPGCNMKTYYAAQKESGACREMFCFELSWLSFLFGDLKCCAGAIDKKLNNVDISADDIYCSCVCFKDVAGTILIDIVSEPAIRNLRIVGEKCNLLWNWNDDHIKLEFPSGVILPISYERGKAADGYNANICEFMYEQEMKNFCDSIQRKAKYLYSREEEEQVIKMLTMLENSAKAVNPAALLT